eukprot:6176397-Pleurochrysis_carterae.AAC.2
MLKYWMELILRQTMTRIIHSDSQHHIIVGQGNLAGQLVRITLSSLTLLLFLTTDSLKMNFPTWKMIHVTSAFKTQASRLRSQKFKRVQNGSRSANELQKEAAS